MTEPSSAQTSKDTPDGSLESAKEMSNRTPSVALQKLADALHRDIQTPKNGADDTADKVFDFSEISKQLEKEEDSEVVEGGETDETSRESRTSRNSTALFSGDWGVPSASVGARSSLGSSDQKAAVSKESNDSEEKEEKKEKEDETPVAAAVASTTSASDNNTSAKGNSVPGIEAEMKVKVTPNPVTVIEKNTKDTKDAKDKKIIQEDEYGEEHEHNFSFEDGLDHGHHHGDEAPINMDAISTISTVVGGASYGTESGPAPVRESSGGSSTSKTASGNEKEKEKELEGVAPSSSSSSSSSLPLPPSKGAVSSTSSTNKRNAALGSTKQEIQEIQDKQQKKDLSGSEAEKEREISGKSLSQPPGSSSSSVNRARGPSKNSPNKSGKATGKATKKYTAYARIVSAVKGKTTNNLGEDPGQASSSMLGGIKERLFSFAGGETMDERRLRLRLDWYRRVLQNELAVVARADKHWKEHSRGLIGLFDSQEMQLQKWGLRSMLPHFRMQAWVRVSRSGLFEELTSEADKAIRDRLKRAEKVVVQYQEEAKKQGDSNSKKQHSLEAYNAFCQTIETIMSKDEAFLRLSHRLLRIDRVCTSTMASFRNSLPLLEPKKFAQRKHELEDILRQHQALHAHTVPESFETKVSWEEFCEFQATRASALRDLESLYADYIEDEREGRAPVPPMVQGSNKQTRQNSRSDDNNRSMSGNGSEQKSMSSAGVSASTAAGGGGAGLSGSGGINKGSDNANNNGNNLSVGPEDLGISTVSPNLGPTAEKMSAKSIVAFVSYFTVNVIADKYNIGVDGRASLHLLTEALVYRRINSFVFRYDTDKVAEGLLERDKAWRLKLELCKRMDLSLFGVPPEYLTGPEEGSKAFIRRAKDAADREKWRVTKDSDVAIDISVEGEGEGEGEGEDGSVTNRDTATKAGAGEEEEEKDSFHIEGDKSRGVDQYMAKFSAAARMADLSCFADQFRGTTAAQKNELVPYARSSQVLSWLSHAVSPAAICETLLLANKWFLKDAVEISGKHDYLGADTTFPIMVLVLVHSNIDNIHLLLHFINEYGETNQCAGEVSYCMTCLQAAVEFLLRMEVPDAVDVAFKAEGGGFSRWEEKEKRIEQSLRSVALTAEKEKERLQRMNTSLSAAGDIEMPSEMTSQQTPAPVGADEGIEKLGEWLRDQETMEDTISILQEEGWML